jgi:hypothetical protein
MELRKDGESTSKWLERLIEIGAPADLRADVRQILAFECIPVPVSGIP